MGLESAGDVTHRKRAEDLGDFEKVNWVEFSLGSRRSAFACSPKPGQWPCGGCHKCWGGADGKVIIERFCISLPYVETFTSKVIKGFVPELRSRYVFFVFRDSYVLCIYVMNILCTFHISVSWIWYIGDFQFLAYAIIRPSGFHSVDNPEETIWSYIKM